MHNELRRIRHCVLIQNSGKISGMLGRDEFQPDLDAYGKQLGLSVENLMEEAPEQREGERNVDIQILRAYFHGELSPEARDEVIELVDKNRSWWIALRVLQAEEMADHGL